MSPARIMIPCVVAGCALLTEPGAAPAQNVAEPATLRFQPLVVTDPAFQMEAFRVLVPAGWQARGSIQWRFHPQYPSAGSMVAVNPTGVEGVAIYPMVPFVEGVWHLRAGQHYIGNEVRAYPGSPAGYVADILLPRYRPELRGYRILGTQDMPLWAEASAAVKDARAGGIPATARAGLVRIGYVEKGKQVEEEFYVCLVSLRMGGLHFWGAEWASSVRAEAGKLASVRKIHQTMMDSLQISLRWYNRERQVAEMMTDACYQEQARVMALSAYLARTQDHIRQTINNSYWRRQAVLDRVHANFSRYIRGVDLYEGPGGRRVELPSGYRQAWVNGLGEYVVSNDGNFNPNEHFNGTWQRLQPAR
jgi:hypothetical protein